MKNYKLLKALPGCSEGIIFTRSNEGLWSYEGCCEYLSDILEDGLNEGGWFEEVTQPSYIVTEEGEIIGEYEGVCWFVTMSLSVLVVKLNDNLKCFITREQAEAHVKREKARRELRVLYYENGYEKSNKDYDRRFEVYYYSNCLEFRDNNHPSNPSLPHCECHFHKKMLELPRVQELYKIIFGIDA